MSSHQYMPSHCGDRHLCGLGENPSLSLTGITIRILPAPIFNFDDPRTIGPQVAYSTDLLVPASTSSPNTTLQADYGSLPQNTWLDFQESSPSLWNLPPHAISLYSALSEWDRVSQSANANDSVKPERCHPCFGIPPIYGALPLLSSLLK